MIHDHFDGYALSRYGVTSGMGLKAELDRLRLAKTFRSYIDHRVANRAFFQSVSESVEQALKFMRRYVSYTFPRSLLAISNIQAEVLTRNGRETVGDYSTFASRAASLFMNSSLFALDEYGVPPETTKRLNMQEMVQRRSARQSIFFSWRLRIRTPTSIRSNALL
ncbi:hypothetical protein [Sphingobium sp. CAP-1]|uniref:hypothetical protein n=1 Tax=Sphingobium sp. CAP-1 TaxID=2676077 RepID=UPI0012BB2299|nr:hypothetical protein [Sphingobium sp. CAP-1]QGP79390.1 hypothetical protein GL174_10645 [Sphingobium sp. CAP-1]